MFKPDFYRAKTEAEKIIVQNGITEPVVPVFELAEKFDYKIKFFSPEGDLNQVAGVTQPESKTIFVNQSDPVYRQSFTIAHELGHIVLGHSPNKYGVLLRNTHKETTDEEKEANAFAAYLLMPDSLLKETMKKYSLTEKNIEILAGIFGVSNEAMRNRLKFFKQKGIVALSFSSR